MNRPMAGTKRTTRRTRSGRFPLHLAVLLLAFDANAAPSPSDPFLAQRLGREEGLAHTAVYSIVQDSTGFIWIATEDGLNRYDGSRFESFSHDPLDPESPAANDIGQLQFDGRGSIWIATWGQGIDRFDPVTGKAKHYRAKPGDARALQDDRVQSLLVDREATLWAGTFAGGLSRYDAATDSFVTYRAGAASGSLSHDRVWSIAQTLDGALWAGTTDGLNRLDRASGSFVRVGAPGSPGALSHQTVRSLYSDRAGVLWIGTHGGLDRITAPGRAPEHYRADPSDPASLVTDSVNSILEDGRGDLWIGMNDSGLAVADRKSGRFIRYRRDWREPNSLSSDDVRCLYEDGSGVLWVGTRGGGITKIDLKPRKFRSYVHNPAKPESLLTENVWAVLEDREGTIWVGTTGGLDRLAPGSETFVHYPVVNLDPKPSPGEWVQALHEDHAGNLWVGLGGLCLFDRAHGGCEALYKPDENRPGAISGNFVTAILEDSRSTLWVGTSRGLNRFNRATARFDVFLHDPANPSSLSDDYVRALYEDRRGDLWIGTDVGGLNRLERQRMTFERFTNGGGEGLSNDRVHAITEDSSGTLWIGTANGLNRLDGAGGRFHQYFERDGLPHPTICGILPESGGALWISTGRGLSRLDVATGKHRNYEHDGLPGTLMYPGVFAKGRDGRMLFGGQGGFCIFDPKGVIDNPHPPRIAITQFRKFDEPVRLETQGLRLTHRDNFFSFEFAALEFTDPRDNRFSYRLEGFDPGWIDAGTRHFATYTNVPPDKYTFRVRASNNNGVWNEDGLALPIVITPPVWQTWWFRITALLLALSLTYLAYRLRMRGIVRRRRELEAKVEEQTRSLRTHAEALQRGRDRLETIDSIVRAINSELDFAKVLEMLLGVTEVFHSVEMAMVLARDVESGAFRIRAAYGWDAAGLQDALLTIEEIRDVHMDGAREVAGGLFVKEGRVNRMTFVLRMMREETVEGYLIYEARIAGDGSRDMIALLTDLRPHVLAAFIKARMLDELAKLNETKNEFLAIAAHDLRTPLGVVGGWVALVIDRLEKGTFDRDKGLGQLHSAHRAAMEMERLVADLLDISAIESGKVALERHRENMARFIEDCVAVHEPTARQKGIRILVDTADGHVVVDPSRITAVLDNLLSNAIKYTHPGGEVRVRCEVIDGEVITHVEDTGQGLSEEDLTNAFKTFKKLSAKPTGGELSTGLGLSIVKKIVEIHGGRVWVRSEKGRGSTFSFALPAAA